MSEIIQKIGIFLIISCSVGIAIADFLGYLGESTWFDERIPTITLLLLGIIAGYLALERRQSLDKIEAIHKNTTEFLDESRSTKIIKFKTGEEAIDYLCKRVNESKEFVDQASLDKRREGNMRKHKDFHKVKNRVIKANKVKYRYLFNVDERRNNNVKEWLEMSPGNFSASGIPTSGEPSGILTFTIFDQKEVYIRSPYRRGSTTRYLSIQEQDIVDLFLEWFDFLWSDAQFLDPNKSIEEIETKLNKLLQNASPN